MKRIQLLLPYSLPPLNVAKDLQAQLKAPHFATLLGLTREQQSWQQADYARAHIHEYFLSTDLSITAPPSSQPEAVSLSQSSPALAHNLMQQFAIASPGYWFLLQPVHLHVALDHLVLTDSQQLQLHAEHAQQLYAMAKSVCDEYGYEIRRGDDKHWFLRADQWSALNTASLNAACGHNIDIWMPQGDYARAWRKLQNEIQMLWFSSAVHQQRESQGLPAINSLWLSYGSAELHSKLLSYRNYQELTQPVTDFSLLVNQYALFKQLELAWLNEDWYQWLQEFAALDSKLFAPLEQALKLGEIDQLELILSRANSLYQLQIQPKRWWHFWFKPDLAILSATPTF